MAPGYKPEEPKILSAAKNYEVKAYDGYTLVKINPAAYKANLLFREEPSEDAEVVINANYVEKDSVIGAFFMNGWMRIKHTIPLGAKGNRPYLFIDGCTAQAGPLLVDQGVNVATPSIIKGGFEPDAVRKTKHTFVGRLSNGKYLLGYAYNHTPNQIAQILIAHGCNWGMKMDGGGSSYLKAPGLLLCGNKQNDLYCGIEFIPRRK